MNQTEYLLSLAQEHAAILVQRLTEVSRSLDEIGGDLIVDELQRVIGIVGVLQDAGIVPKTDDAEILKARFRFTEYVSHLRERGRFDQGPIYLDDLPKQERPKTSQWLSPVTVNGKVYHIINGRTENGFFALCQHVPSILVLAGTRAAAIEMVTGALINRIENPASPIR